ncbi:MAG: hypothetical protein HRF51_10300 [bacterium]|jgi:hypothetical protein
MKSNLLIFTLHLILLAGAATVLAQEKGTESETVPVDSSIAPADSSHQLFVYYFHGNRRCASCIKIEKYTKESLDSLFQKELSEGRILWQVVNTDLDSNQHFLEDYNLYTKSVVLVDMHNGKQARWKNLEKVWEYLNSKNSFSIYIRDEVNDFLKEE